MKLGFIKFTLSNVRYPHDSTRIASVDLQRMKILPNYTEKRKRFNEDRGLQDNVLQGPKGLHRVLEEYLTPPKKKSLNDETHIF